MRYLDFLIKFYCPALLGGLFGGKPKKAKASAQEKALIEIAGKQQDLFENTFIPLDRELAKRQEVTEAKLNNARGVTNTEAQLAGRGRDAALVRMAPGGRSAAALTGAVSASDSGVAQAGAAHGLRAQSAGGTLGRIATGSKVGSNAITGLIAQGKAVTEGNIQKMKAEFAKQREIASLIGTAAGVGMSAYGKPPAGGDTLFNPDHINKYGY